MGEKKTNEVSLGNLYDINKELVKKLPRLSAEKIYELCIEKCDNLATRDYILLQCREINSITMIINETHKASVLGEDLADLIISFGHVIAVDKVKNNDNALEIWIMQDGEAYCYYCYDYTQGVIIS